MSRTAPVKKPRFICEVCEAEVPLEAESCPNCGRIFSSTLCPGCGYSGAGYLFEFGCPACGYKAGGGKAAPPAEPQPAARAPERRAWYSHISYYLLALAVFTALAAALIFNMF